MFCPKCGFEYREGYEICSDCGSLLVDNIDDDKKYYNKVNRLRLLLTSFHSSINAIIYRFMNSKSALTLSCVFFKMFCVSLALLNFFSLRIKTLWTIGPDWEIPVDLVSPIHFFSQCTLICMFLCIILFLLGYKRFKIQKKIDKIISMIWFLGSIIFIFTINFRDLPEDIIYTIVKYGWISMIVPLLLFIYLLFQDNKITFKSK